MHIIIWPSAESPPVQVYLPSAALLLQIHAASVEGDFPPYVHDALIPHLLPGLLGMEEKLDWSAGLVLAAEVLMQLSARSLPW